MTSNPADSTLPAPKDPTGGTPAEVQTADRQPEPMRERVLSPAARRALAEAEDRRRAQQEAARTAEKEIGGRGGADPARFGDWEINGRAIDF